MRRIQPSCCRSSSVASAWACSSRRSPTSSSRPSGREEEGKASGANNAIREVGGVFGVAVLAAIFTANGSYFTPDAYVAGLVPGGVGRSDRRRLRGGRGALHPQSRPWPGRRRGPGRRARHRRSRGSGLGLGRCLATLAWLSLGQRVSAFSARQFEVGSRYWLAGTARSGFGPVGRLVDRPQLAQLVVDPQV